MGVEQLDPVAELRRRERQQALVAELGRSALTGTELPELFEEALAAAADGLAGARVEFCEPRPETMEPLITERELAAPVRGPEVPVTVLAEQTRGVAGTGLGLYVCKELVERMDGRISVVSKLGRGSTFVVELPRR